MTVLVSQFFEILFVLAGSTSKFVFHFFELFFGTCPAMFFFTSSNKKMFCFTSFCHFFIFLREIFLTSLG